MSGSAIFLAAIMIGLIACLPVAYNGGVDAGKRELLSERSEREYWRERTATAEVERDEAKAKLTRRGCGVGVPHRRRRK